MVLTYGGGLWRYWHPRSAPQLPRGMLRIRAIWTDADIPIWWPMHVAIEQKPRRIVGAH